MREKIRTDKGKKIRGSNLQANLSSSFFNFNTVRNSKKKMKDGGREGLKNLSENILKVT